MENARQYNQRKGKEYNGKKNCHFWSGVLCSTRVVTNFDLEK